MINVFVISDDAVKSGTANSTDVESIALQLGGFCFALNDNCIDSSAQIAFIPVNNSSIQFDSMGNISGGVLNGSGFSPTFNMQIPIEIDFDQDTISVGHAVLGFANAEMQTLAIDGVDSDADGLFDVTDNCVMVANADQEDFDADGFGNVCDPDIDNNCAVNFLDYFLVSKSFNMADDELDLTGDGFVNFNDITIVSGFFGLPPGPSGDAACF